MREIQTCAAAGVDEFLSPKPFRKQIVIVLTTECLIADVSAQLEATIARAETVRSFI